MAMLATMIMEGASFGGKLERHYDHENGAGLIAMESAEALHSIFESSFYVTNTCAIQAALEGASCVEESSQAAIMENAFTDAFAKIKEFFVKLKDKVKEFLHNIKRYLLGVFGNDEEWVKKYEKDLKAINSADLKDYKIKMYTYTIDKALDSAGLVAAAEAVMNGTKEAIKKVESDTSRNFGEEEAQDHSEAVDKLAEEEISEFIKNLVGKSVDEDEIDETLWSRMRNEADGEGDKEDVTVSNNISKFIEVLKKSSKDLSAYDTMISKTDSMYQKAIKEVTNAEKAWDNAKKDETTGRYETPAGRNAAMRTGGGTYTQRGGNARSYILEYLRKMSSTLSKMQTLENKKTSAAKAAMVERNAAYKSALTGAFAYARKHKGGK